MKSYERRQLGKTTYYKLAEWDNRNFAFRDGKQSFDTPVVAAHMAIRPGRYRISKVTEAGREDLEPFEVK